MIEYINNKLIPTLLTNRKWRVFRHLLLFVVLGFLSLGMTIDGSYKSEYGYVIERILLLLLFAGIFYVNMYALVPYFLFKNKLSTYFISLLSSILILLFLLILVQFALHEIDSSEQTDYLITFISLINTIIGLVFFVACSSSFIIMKNWIIYDRRIKELETTTLQTELQQLKSQINPHFLFNTLNNANILINENKETGSLMLEKLDDLLCYQIHESNKEQVLLSEDIAFLTDYLELEKSRRNKFDYKLSVEGDIENILIPPLLFITFVENAVKYSPDIKNESYVYLSFTLQEDMLGFYCVNSKSEIPMKQKRGGLGLTNIKRRLDLLYGENYFLEINDAKTVYRVNLQLKV